MKQKQRERLGRWFVYAAIAVFAYWVMSTVPLLALALVLGTIGFGLLITERGP